MAALALLAVAALSLAAVEPPHDETGPRQGDDARLGPAAAELPAWAPWWWHPSVPPYAHAQSGGTAAVMRVFSPDPDGVYGTGRTVAVTVVFNEAVAVAGGGDAPLIRLATNPPRDAVYSGRGNGTAELEFWYTVQPGDAAADLGYTGPAALSMGGGGGAAIRNLAGNAANASLPAPGSPYSLSASGDIQVHGAKLPVLAAARSAGHSGAFPELDQPYSVAAFELGDRNETYALVAGYDGDGIQLVRIDEHGHLSAAYSLDRNRNALELNGAIDIDVIDLGVNDTFAVVASFWDDNIQLVRIPEHGQLWPTGAIDDLDDGALELDGPLSVDAFRTAGGTAFALVASRYDNGIQLLRIGYTIEAADSLDMTDNGGLPLEDAGGVAAFRTANGTTLALVASFGSDGIQLVRVDENGTLAAVSSATSADAGFARLDSASFVSAIRAPDGSNSTLAMVTPSGRNHMQLIRVHDNGTLEPEGSAADGQNGFDTLGRPQHTDFFEMDGRTYSIVAARVDDGVQLVRVRENATLEAAGSAVDGRYDFAELEGARGIDAFETAGGRMYAVVASRADNGLQTIRLSPPHVAGVSTSLPNGTYPSGYRFNVTVAFDEPVVVSGPPPRLLLALDGGRTGAAEYVSGSGTNSLVFGYEVRRGDSTAAAANGGTLDYAGPAALATRGIITDLRAAGGTGGKAAAADLELPAPGEPGSLGAHGIRIDGRVPLVRDISFLSASGTYTAGSALHIAVMFDKDVLVSGEPRLALSTFPPASAAYASGNGTDELVFVYTVRDGDAADGLGYASRTALSADADEGASIRDEIGNDADLSLPDPGSLGPSGIVIDARAPSAMDVYPLNASGTYTAGSELHIAVRFDEDVLVSGTPQLALSTSPQASAAYASGGGTDELVFVYTVRDGDAADALGYSSRIALAPNGGAIRDAAGNDALLVLPAPDGQGLLGAVGRIRIDAVAPRVVSVSSPDADGTYGIGSRISVTATFDEPVRVEGAPRLPLETGGGVASRHAVYVPGDSSPATTLAFAYTVLQGDRTGDLDHGDGALIDLDGGAIRDEAGNNASLALPPAGSPESLGGSKDIVIDAAGRGPSVSPGTPVVVSVNARAPPAAASYTAGQTIAIDVVFSAPVSVGAPGGGGSAASAAGAGAPYLELVTGSAGARAGYASGSGGTDTIRFEYTVRGGDITDRLSYAGTDALRLGGGAITAAGSTLNASTVLPPPGAPGSLSAPGSPAIRIDPEPGRPVLDVGILDDEEGAGLGGVSKAALAAAYAFNEEQGRTDGALLLNATAYDAGGTVVAPASPAAAAALLQAAHSGGAGPSVYVGPSTDRGLHAAMPYAAGNGIVLVSAGSTAPSLAVEDDWTFRFLPSGRLDAEALARLARAAGAQSMIAVLENTTHGPPPTAAGTTLDDATPPPPDRFSRALDAALAYAGSPTLSGTITLEGAAAAGGPYEAAAAAEALDAAVQSAPAPVAVVYAGSPQGLAALAEASDSYTALASAAWIASGPSANSSLLAGDGPAAAFAVQAGLQAARWSTPSNDLARAIDSLLPSGDADAAVRHRAYAAYDAMGVIGAAAALAAADTRGNTPDTAAVAGLIPDAAAAYDGALGDIALNSAGDLWVPAVYDLWTVSQAGGGAGTGAEWTLQQGALDETRACSIALTRAKIDYGPIDSGQTSRPHLQTIVNTGQLSFSRVDLTATPWHVDSPGSCAPGAMPSLPVGLSEIRTVQGGAFSDLAASGTVLAQGLEAGSRAPLWYRLSLAGYADLPQAEITQCATYVVRCG